MRHSVFVILPGFGLTSLVIGLLTRMSVSFFAVWATGLHLTNALICVSYTFRFRFELSGYRIVYKNDRAILSCLWYRITPNKCAILPLLYFQVLD